MDIYLHFNGQAAEVLAFYEDVFKTSAQIMTFGQMPHDDNFPIDDAIKDLIVNSNLKINETNVMIADSPESLAPPLVVGNNMALVFNAKTAEEALDIFQRLAENGTILLPLEKTFWAEQYGMVKDQYDIIWHINLY
ncbi:VOC family protein [Enterococcus dongliensis]|uniref:VOC family protein n=1 Tax=Enterococcus dongliensis TaxID=2559925 RepID=A0ABU3EU50_9ENTE|nr:VOC family protein [Enterococcus dongliensis]MDT2597511.1 VOC family protein [Enterococcus dongliensis]MDT2603045.1 VOC family protein [Enterococcus dongliensis]MDT2612397.1 VOC family protein [Enterococcus dongliensis]MDT2633389.1 VOC family protein [Enterococcus dongliensis]MDT2638859.1 VOC family protein [Enterococcus dongliensis]